MAKQEQRKGKGCLKVIGIILAIFVALGIYGSTLPSDEMTEPLQTFFYENGLGTIDDIEETDRGGLTTQYDFKANYIEYTAYIFKKPYKEFKTGDIAMIATDDFLFYSTDDNDLVLDDKEKALLVNRANYLKLTSGYTNVVPAIIKRDLENRLNYPETLKIKKVVTKDAGDYFLQVVEFRSKNAFGMESRNYAKYKIDFKTNAFEFKGIER